ncbi:hypothetical protein RAH06_08320, partial [Klebsiella pneumoniae]
KACVLPENPASYRVVRTKSYLFNKAVLSYLAKEEQKEGLCAYGCNDVPPRSAAGRPRKPGP